MGVKIINREPLNEGKTLSQVFLEEERRQNPAREEGFTANRNQLLAAIEEALTECGVGYENRTNKLLAIEADLNSAWQKAFKLPNPNPGSGIDKYQIAANVELERLDGFEGRLSSAMQKKVFGADIFGRKNIKIDARGQGEVTGWFKIAFGQDYNTFRFSFEEIADLVNSGDRPRF